MGIRDGRNLLPLRYMGSQDKYENVEAVIVGAPMDWTCSFKPGARFGPQKIREVSIGIEEYSLYQNRSLEDKQYFDCGDLDLPFGNVQKSIELIEDAVSEIFSDNKFPILLGGEHLVSLPAVRQAHKKFGGDLRVIQLDAHADLREDYIGEKLCHASVMRRVCEFVHPENVFQVGIRSASREEKEFGEKNTRLYPFDVIKPLKDAAGIIGDKPVYVTLDIDVVDPAYANGTGTPEPGGCTSREILDAVRLFKDFNLVGFDLVEVSPSYDTSGRTAILAAEIVREILLVKV